MKNDDIVGLGKSDELVVELVGSGDTHRVGGIGYHHHLGLVCQLRFYPVQIGKVAVFFLQRVMDDFCPTQGGAHLKDGIAGVRHQHHISWVTQSPADVGQPFLRAVDAHQLLWLQFHAIATQIPVLDRLHQLRQLGERIAVVGGLTGRLGQGLYHVGVREKVRGANGQIVHRKPLGQPLLAAFIQDIENTRLEFFHALGNVEFHERISSILFLGGEVGENGLVLLGVIADELEELGLIQDGNAQFIGLAQLGACRLSSNDTAGLFGHGAGHLGSQGLQHPSSLLAGAVGQLASEHKGEACQTVSHGCSGAQSIYPCLG